MVGEELVGGLEVVDFVVLGGVADGLDRAVRLAHWPLVTEAFDVVEDHVGLAALVRGAGHP